MCCETAPDGWHEPKPSGLENSEVAALYSYLLGISLSLLTAFFYLQPVPNGNIHDIIGIAPEAKKDVKRLLDVQFLYMLMCVGYYTVGGIFVDPSQVSEQRGSQ